MLKAFRLVKNKKITVEITKISKLRVSKAFSISNIKNAFVSVVRVGPRGQINTVTK